MTGRTWNAGDPEPIDTEQLVVIDCEGDRWTQQEPNAWFNDDFGPDYAVAWDSILEFAPLREATPDVPASAAQDPTAGTQ